MPVSSNRLLAALRPQAPPDPGGSVLPTDMAYWGGQRLYGALARAPKTAERRSGPALPETCGRKKLPHGSGRLPNGTCTGILKCLIGLEFLPWIARPRRAVAPAQPLRPPPARPPVWRPVLRTSP